MNTPGSSSRTSTTLAAAILIGAGLLSWERALGSGALRMLPAAVLAVALVSRRLPVRSAAPVALAWLIATPLLAALPLAVLQPSAWSTTSTAIADAAQQLTTPGAATGATGWPLALALGTAGLSWLIGGALTVDRGPLRLLGFAFLAAPMGAANLFQADVAWQGAALAAAALLWLSPRRATVAAVGAIAVAVLALAVTDTMRPQGRWLVSSASASSQSAFTTLNTAQTYGPLDAKRSGRTMLEITATQPELWRAQVLDRFDGRAWHLGGASPALPQPAAVPTTSTVRVRGLKDDLVVAPGTIDSVSATHGHAHRWLGSSWILGPTPSSGDTYQVRSSVVQTDESRLAAIPFSRDPAVLAYTDIDTAFGTPREDPAWLTVQALAQNVTAGATTPLQDVHRVQSYLRDSGTFTYTTNVPAAGPDPIVDFLLHDHRGYCQQFAGAAALLLRMSGVPARVVVGFATGRAEGDHRYDVRDEDAHAWIEVYFQGVGWVPFNPTPSADAAAVDDAATLLPPPTAATPSGSGTTRIVAGGGAAIVLLAGGGLLLRRRRRHATGAAGSRPAPGAGPAADRLTAGLERIAGPLPPAHTLGQLGADLAEHVGPHTAALAAEVEHARYAPAAKPLPRRPRRVLWRALRADVGARRAARLLLLG